MKSSLKKREGPEGLVFRVRHARKASRTALSLVLLAASFALIWRSLPARVDQGFFACVVALLITQEIVSRWKGVDVELRVTKLEFVSAGHAPSGYAPSIIARADIYDLQYREPQDGGGESLDSPEGLYVEYSRILPGTASGCILPGVGKEQTEEIIRSILDRFPDTGKLATRPSDGSRLISLNLNGRDDR